MAYLFAPQNLIFIIALFVGIVLVLGNAFGVMGHDAEHDVDHDVDHDVEHEHAGGEHDHEGHHEHQERMFLRALSLLGIGKVPFSVVWMTAALVFGGAGIVLNTVLAPVLLAPWIYGWLSFAGAIVTMVAVTGNFARIVHRLMPTTETYIGKRSDLVGCTGTLVLTADDTRGLANVHDPRGNLLQVTCRAMNGSTIPSGAKVTVVDYMQENNIYVVEISSAA